MNAKQLTISLFIHHLLNECERSSPLKTWNNLKYFHKIENESINKLINASHLILKTQIFSLWLIIKQKMQSNKWDFFLIIDEVKMLKNKPLKVV